MRRCLSFAFFPLLAAWTGTALLSAPAANAQEPLIQAGDLVLGLGRSDPAVSLELVRGAAEEFGGQSEGNLWVTPFMQSVEFDNLGGISRNPEGNLIGVNFGTAGAGGSIHSLATQAIGVADEKIGDSVGLGGAGLTLSRLGSAAISPDNSKLAVMGYDSGKVIVYDYTPANGLGVGASLSGGRETAGVLFEIGDTQGTGWLDNQRVVLFSADGDLVQVDANTMATSIVAQIDTGSGPGDNRSEFTSVAFDATISPYLFLSYSGFDRDTSVRLNKIYVVDPANGFSLAKEIDISQSSDSLREIALGPDGSLFMSQFTALVDVIPNAIDIDSLTDDSSIDWYIPVTTASFSGITVAVGKPIATGPDGDFNGDGSLGVEDIDLLTTAVQTGSSDSAYDVNQDGSVNGADRESWVVDIKRTYYGDSNLDGEFSSTDLVLIFSAGQYEDGIAGNSTWGTGDWTGDGEFDTTDLVLAFQMGGYEIGPRAAVAAVPEPTTLGLLLIGCMAGLQFRRRTSARR